MRKLWLQLSDRFNALADRERLIVFVSLASAVCAITFLLFIDPMLSKRARLQGQLKQQTAALKTLREQQQILTQQMMENPDASRKQQIEQLSQENQDRRAELQRLQQSLAAPERMPRLLADLLDRNSGLELVSLKTLPPENLLQKDTGTQAERAPGAIGANGQVMTGVGLIGLQVGDASASAPVASSVPAQQRAVWRHGLQVVVRGNWNELTAYARKIETMPWRLYWGDLNYRVVRYPQAEMSFTVYTISLDQAWLSL